MIIDQDREKKLALTLMYLSIFFLYHIGKCETERNRKRKSTRPVENFIKPCCFKKLNPSYENITIVDSDVEICSDEEWCNKKYWAFVLY